jgi:hypothetical protein
MLAPIRLTNAAAQLVLRTQVRRKEKHPHPALLHPRPYAVRPEIVSSRQGDASIPTLLHTSPAPTRVTTWVVTGVATVAADPARIILLALPR